MDLMDIREISNYLEWFIPEIGWDQNIVGTLYP